MSERSELRRSGRPSPWARRLAVALFLAGPTPAPTYAAGSGSTGNPLAGTNEAAGASTPYTSAEIAELDKLAETVNRYEAEAVEYRAATRALIEHKYRQKRDALHNSYEEMITKLEAEQRRQREDAITAFEAFLAKYPAEVSYTPDALFRLSELYFERSYDAYFQGRQAYEQEIAAWDPNNGTPEPVEPQFHYEPTIASLQRLITQYPDYRLIDGAYYLLGYCLAEQSEEERAVDVYQELLARRPQSRFAAEVWTRIGEYYFDVNELVRALAAYSAVLAWTDSPFYDKALYKLAWTHYRLADPERAPEEFQRAVDTFVQLLDFHERHKAAGSDRGGDLRGEAIQYVAISFADEQWGGLDKAVAYFQSRGGRPYERDVLEALGEVYFDQTRFPEAIRALQLVRERYPHHRDTPAIQEKIVLAYERSRDFERAAAERDVLARSYSSGSAWFEVNKGDAEALARAGKLTAESLYSAALFHHKQAQIHREAQRIDLAKEAYERAASSYGVYLARFPHDRQLYELTFYYAECLYYSLHFREAAAQYETVRDSTASDRFREEAAFSVILSYENLVKAAEAAGALVARVKKSSERAAGEDLSPKPIPEDKRHLIAASDTFAKLLPHNVRVPKVLYKAAEIHYTYDDFEEARRRFREIVAAYPNDEVAEYATNLVIESYLTEKRYAEVETFSREMLGRVVVPGRRQEFAGELVKFKAGAMFKLAEGLDQRGEYEHAAELYQKLLAENPESEFADTALNNAAVAFEKVKRFDSASRLYERLVAEHPRSPLADTALFRVGLSAERFFDFEKAIATYTRLVERYPKSERRADALYNAALALENTQQYERGAREYLRYCELFRKRDDAPEVCFRAGLVYEKMGEPRRVVTTYQAYVKSYRTSRRHTDRVVEAFLKMAQAYEELGEEKAARNAYETAVREFRRNPTAKAAPIAAAARFALVEREFAAFRTLRLHGNSKEQKRALTRKAEVLRQVENRYKAILGFKQIDWTLASLFRIGQLYQDFADSLTRAPCPPDVRKAARGMGATADEVCDEYRVLLEEKAAAIEDKAVVAYETTITRAREFQVANQWTKQTLVALNKLRGKLWPLQKDAKEYVDELVRPRMALVDAQGRFLPLVQAPVLRNPGSAPEDAAAVQARAPSESTGAKRPTAGSGISARPPSPTGEDSGLLPPAAREKPSGDGAPSSPNAGDAPPPPPPPPSLPSGA